MMPNSSADTLLKEAGKAPLLVDRREAGRLLGVSPGTIDNLRLRGELPSVKIAARRLFDVADLHRFIEARKEVGK
ncbi:MAG TPA: helix-turn-helix domain-containing protein [Phycisphaerales bacterium]|nr:helix-turn-helix domain-containing protein [Phycisphaerales bacterium]